MKKTLLVLLVSAISGSYGFSQEKVTVKPLKVRDVSKMINEGAGINGIPTGAPNWSIYNFDQGTNEVDDCEAVNVPYYQDFSFAVVPGMPECTTVENAGTGNNWHTYSGTDGGFTGTYLRYQWHGSNPANSWFYTQGINMTAGVTYTVTYDYGTESAGAYPESLKVAYGTNNTSTAMTNVLAVHEDFITSEQAITNGVEFTPETTGVYYIGFNAFSDANMFYMYLDNIKVESDEVVAEACEWTINVSGAGYGDEISWEFRDANGVVLAGGEYETVGFNDVQTITAAGPVEFYIEAMGLYGDNEASYVISNANGIQASGDLYGDDEATHSDMNCEDEGAEPTYCEPELDCTDGDLITNVTFQEINNDSECSENGYGNYTSLIANVEAGETYPINVTVGGGFAYESVSVWIDYDNSMTFDENEFTYVGTGSAGVVNGQIVIPDGLAEGQYRMRVRVAAVNFGTATWDMACNEGQGYGETEDYTINVGPGEEDPIYCEPVLDCTDNDVITNVTFAGINNDTTCSENGYGNYTSMVANVVAGETYPINVTVGNGWAYESVSVWVDYNNNGEFEESEFTYIGTGSAETLTGDIAIPADAQEGNYRMRVRLAAVGEVSATWDMACDETQGYGETEDYTVNVGPGEEEPIYCEPVLDCTDNDVITNVTFAGIDNDTTCSENGYGNYTSMVANVVAGETYPINVTVGNGWAYESVSVWVDYNNNGEFEESEFTYIGTGSAETLSGDIVIPADVAEGNYRMRVRVAAVGEVSATWDMACDETQGYGETEDYTIQIEAMLGAGDLTSSQFAYYPNPVKDVLNVQSKEGVKSVQIFNLAGQQVVANAKVANGQINVAALPQGTYVFRVTLENGVVETFKIIKK